MSNPVIEVVESVSYVNTHSYYNEDRKKLTFNNYIIHLEGHPDPYHLSKLNYTNEHVPGLPEIGDRITCDIYEGRLKKVKVLYDVVRND
jgi:hypothetical protein